MSASRSTDAADQLRVMLHSLEQALLAHIQQFERTSGMRVHSMKVFHGEPKNGRRITESVEIAAQLR
jgi:hypothetical protein